MTTSVEDTSFEKALEDWKEMVAKAEARGDDDVAALALAIANVSKVVLEWNRPVPPGFFEISILGKHEASVQILDAISKGLDGIRKG